MNLTGLIKLIKLELTYIVLYLYIDTTQTLNVNTNCNPYFKAKFLMQESRCF
jgi:hypothetical protein